MQVDYEINRSSNVEPEKQDDLDIILISKFKILKESGVHRFFFHPIINTQCFVVFND